MKSIRLVRVARALRLVARFQSLRKIVNALTQAVFPVLSACFVAIMASKSELFYNFFFSRVFELPLECEGLGALGVFWHLSLDLLVGVKASCNRMMLGDCMRLLLLLLLLQQQLLV